jgi:FKBP-type peptidyl-prolyl cis-trans isomerase
MINKFEAFGIFFCVGTMALALFLLELQDLPSTTKTEAINDQQASVVGVAGGTLEDTIKNSMNTKGTVQKLIIDDITEGVGEEVKAGDTVSVNYIGSLQAGEEFDNSYKRGEPFSFTVGEGRVIKGWEEGLLGMKVTGKRVLVIPAEMAYGASAVGPIPANSTLVFVIELLEIKN